MAVKLSQRDLKQYRAIKLRDQEYLCPLCLTEIHPDDAALDHDHVTGHCRDVLHKSCNAAEGRIIHWAKRSRTQDVRMFLENLLDYWSVDYSSDPIHPTHLTPNQKLILKLKRKLKKLKSKKRIKELKAEIQQLEAEDVAD